MWITNFPTSGTAQLQSPPWNGQFLSRHRHDPIGGQAIHRNGIRLVEEVALENLFLLGAGEMGIGNTSSAAAILCALTGAAPRDVVGRGTGIDDPTWSRKVGAIERGLELNRPDEKTPSMFLRKWEDWKSAP